MNGTPSAKVERVLIDAFEKQFARLHERSSALIAATPTDLLYRTPQSSKALPLYSIGENLLRSAAAVERTFGGITANLWDDPFEWTLPENLSTVEGIIEYLEEVEATRRRAFASFARDADLLKEVQVPSGETKPLVDLLTETLVRAAEYYGRAAVTLRLFWDVPVHQAPPF
jgi:hypothetical protein